MESGKTEPYSRSRGPLKRLVEWGLLVALVIGSVVWTGFIPTHKDLLVKPMPSYASAISRHEDPLARWTAARSNAFLRGLFSAYGMDLDSTGTDGETLQGSLFLRLLADQTITLAALPPTRTVGAPGWAFTTWVGGRAVWLRWLLSVTPQSDIEQVGSMHGCDIWMVPVENPEGVPVYFTLCKGMLMGTLDASPEVLQAMIHRTFIHAADWDGLQQELSAGNLCFPGESEDRVWIRSGAPVLPSAVRASVEEISPTRLKGRLCMDQGLSGLGVLDPGEAEEVFQRFSWPNRLAWLVLRGGVLRAWVEDQLSLELATVSQVMDDKPAWISFQEGVLGATLLGMDVPSIAAGLPVEEAEAHRFMRSVLDALNANRKRALVPRVVSLGGYAVTIIEPSVPTPYGLLPDAEKVGYLVKDGWMVAASQAGVLQEAAAWMDAGHPAQTLDEPLPTASGHLGLDMKAIQRTVPSLIRLWKFKLLLDRSAEADRRREHLTAAEQWLQLLSPVQAARFSLYSMPESSMVEIEFRVEDLSVATAETGQR